MNEYLKLQSNFMLVVNTLANILDPSPARWPFFLSDFIFFFFIINFLENFLLLQSFH